MAITTLWKTSQSELRDRHVRAMLGLAGDGRLRDSSDTSTEFREFLTLLPIEILSRYALECLGEGKFEDSGSVLQDIVNEIGRRLDFGVENGLYQGRSNEVGFDGIWKAADSWSLVIEVKTTDVYSINLDTLARYRRLLTQQQRIGEHSSILIVMGRKETGGLEAQIRGSPHAWDIRLISVEALLRLLSIRQNLDDPKVMAKINAILRPQEFTRVDAIIDLVFSTTEEVKKEEELVEESEIEGSEKKPKFHPVNFRDECAKRLEAYWQTPLLKRSAAFYSSADQEIGVYCLNSRQHGDQQDPSYWFAFHPHQRDELAQHKRGFVALGCGSSATILVLPAYDFETWLRRFNTTQLEDRPAYWHIQVFRENDEFFIRTKGGGERIDATPFLLSAQH